MRSTRALRPIASSLFAIIASVFVFTSGLTGCASYFLRRSCEKINWYQHGYDVAMSGRRLDADDQIRECRKVEAKMSDSELDTGFKAGMSKYCTGDNVFAVGKAGHPFSYDMCDGESAKKMKFEYENGLVEFCTPENGFRFGASGSIYEKVCHKNTEEAFLAQYRKGRKVFLTAAIVEKEREIQSLGEELSRLQMQRVALQLQHSTMAHSTTTQRTQIFDPQTGTYVQSVTQVPDVEAEGRAQQLQNEISSVNYDIQRTQDKRHTLNEELGRMRVESASL